MVADDGVLVPATVSQTPGGTITFGVPGGVVDPIPVVPGLPLTASAYAAGTGAYLYLIFRNASGGYVSTHTALFVASMSRRSITRTAPAGAVDAMLRVVAGPAASVRAGARA